MPPHISSRVSWHSKSRPALNSATPLASARRSSSSSDGSAGAVTGSGAVGAAYVLGGAAVGIRARRLPAVAAAADDHADLLEGHGEHAAQDQPGEAEADRELDESHHQR